jgi:UrcA family protein
MKTQTTANHFARLFGTTLIAAGMLGGHAFAADSFSETPSTVVKFGDLNLTSQQGVASLYKRIHSAAEQVCGASTADTVFPEVSLSIHKCVVDSETRAIRAVNNGALEAYYSKKTGRPMPVFASNQK